MPFCGTLKKTAVIRMAKKKKYHVSLSDDEVKQLKALIRNGNSSRTVKYGAG